MLRPTSFLSIRRDFYLEDGHSSDLDQKRSCESGCAYHGITDFVTNTLMKVQHVAVSENRVHSYCAPRTVIWAWRFVLSANVTESAAWIEVKRTLNIGSVSIADYLVAENLM